MFKKLENYIEEVKGNYKNIPSSRIEKLHEVAKYIQSKITEHKIARLNFICTHNSRRSHLAQIWTATAAHYFEISSIETYSGGTEATAFNPRAVAAIKRAGFEVKHSGKENPQYYIRFSENSAPLICFSKKFDDPYNPDKDFGAIMTCSDADENCPLVPGAEFRTPITYQDPKAADDTKQETKIYDDRCRQIATEMFYMVSLIHPV